MLWHSRILRSFPECAATPVTLLESDSRTRAEDSNAALQRNPPFLVFDKLDWLFWGWLKAYLGFSFYKVVAAATLNVLSHVLTNYYIQLGQSLSDPSLIVQTLPLLVLLVLVNIYIPFKIPTMTHSLFTGGTGGHGGGLGVAVMAIRAAM